MFIESEQNQKNTEDSRWEVRREIDDMETGIRVGDQGKAGEERDNRTLLLLLLLLLEVVVVIICFGQHTCLHYSIFT